LYQNANQRDDGYYHCPWEGQFDCPHRRSEKIELHRYVLLISLLSLCAANLLLFYRQQIDSHLKIFRSEIRDCGLRFGTPDGLQHHKKQVHDISGSIKKDNKDSPLHSTSSSGSKEGKADSPDALLTTENIEEILLSRYFKARVLLRYRAMMDCDPRNAGNLDHLRIASNALKEMAQISVQFQAAT
jgi:hypothetical protein